MQTRDFQLRVKQLTEAGTFTGLAAVYDAPDMVGDVIRPGAFAKSIAEQGAGKPLLWSHRQDMPIGLGRIEDSTRGLLIHGEIDRADPDGATAYNRLTKGTVKGLSIGFTVDNPDSIRYEGGSRYLSEIRLHEVSLVAIPAQPAAQVLDVKSLSATAAWIDRLAVGELTDELRRELRSLQEAVQRRLPDALSNSAPSALLADLRELATLARGRG